MTDFADQSPATVCPEVVCYIGLGANLANALGTPKQHLLQAVMGFLRNSAFKQVAVSSLYQSAPVGPTDQPDFFNAVLRATTTLAPLALLDFCQHLETKAGRKRVRHWGERSLDVDVLLYGTQTIASERLTVPHTQLFLRNFVLIPLLEIAPALMVNGQALAQFPAAKDNSGLQKISAIDWQAL